MPKCVVWKLRISFSQTKIFTERNFQTKNSTKIKNYLKPFRK